MNRDSLPYRKNCEGYFITTDSLIVARDTGKGYLELPGGGVDTTENPAEALIREAHEEAGVILEGELEEKEILHFLWDENWATTEKQKKRYASFKGEEMHFFIGKVKELVTPLGDPETGDSGWEGRRTMTIQEAIDLVNQGKPFSEDIKAYREIQLKILHSLL